MFHNQAGVPTAAAVRSVTKRRVWDGVKYIEAEVVKILGRYYPVTFTGLLAGDKRRTANVYAATCLH